MHIRINRPATDTGHTPVICFHMSPHSGRIYEAFLEDLGRDRLAVAPDTPGFGYSDAPDAPPSIDDYADSMIGLIDALGIEGPVDLMGYHTGSLTSLNLAHRYPDRVRRLLIVSLSMYNEDEREGFLAQYGPDAISEDGSHLAKIFSNYWFWQRQGGKTLEQAADSFPERLMGRSKSWWGHQAAINFRREDVVGKIEQPILILNPGDDLTEYTRRAQPMLQNGRILEVPNWAHGFLDVHTADAARLARSYFDAPDDNPFGDLQPGSGA